MNLLFNKLCLKTSLKTIFTCLMPMVICKIVSLLLLTYGFWILLHDLFVSNWNAPTYRLWLVATLMVFMFLETATGIGYFFAWLFCERKRKNGTCCLEKVRKL